MTTQELGLDADSAPVLLDDSEETFDSREIASFELFQIASRKRMSVEERRAFDNLSEDARHTIQLLFWGLLPWQQECCNLLHRHKSS